MKRFFIQMRKAIKTWWQTHDDVGLLLQRDIPLVSEQLREHAILILPILQGLVSKHEGLPAEGHFTVVKSYRPDFQQLVSQLKEINLDLSEGRIIRPQNCEGYPRATRLDAMFVTQDNRYVNWTQLDSFCHEAKKLCDLTAPLLGATYGDDEHNLRVLTYVFATVCNVTKGLIQTLR